MHSPASIWKADYSDPRFSRRLCRRACGCTAFLLLLVLLSLRIDVAATVEATLLSPLQAYLYSGAAVAESLTRTRTAAHSHSVRRSQEDAAPSSPLEQTLVLSNDEREKGAGQVGGAARIGLMQSVHNRLSVESSAAAARNATHAGASSSSSTNAAATPVSSFVGRYIVLARSARAASSSSAADATARESRGPSTARTAGQPSVCAQADTSLPRHKTEMRHAVCALAYRLDTTTDVLDVKGNHASVSSASSTHTVREPRVFPEEALRQLAAAAGTFTSRPPRPTGAPAGARSMHLERRRSAMQLGITGLSVQEEAVPGRSSFPSGASPADLETHVIDAEHILVYFPPTDSSAALLRILMGSDAGGESEWRVWDAFGSGSGGPQLKLSEALRRRMRSASDAAETTAVVEVTLWTARGAANAVREGLTASPRLRHYLTDLSSHNGAASSPAVRSVCRLVWEPAAESASDSVSVQIHLPTERKTTTPAVHNTSMSSATAKDDGEQQNLRRNRDCLRTVLLRLAAHPAVRWVEESHRQPELLNNVAASVLQHGSCSSYAAQAGAYANANAPSLPHPFWDLGINGTGEIIAIADSGVDTESCFFRDPDEEVALYPAVNPRHRKILSYQAYVNTEGVVDKTDQPAGHGTHVAGSACGCVLPGVEGAKAEMTAFNGVAPGAKLFVRDMAGPRDRTLILPTNVRDILDAEYAVGARISSNSWGFPAGSSVYQAMERVFDSVVTEKRNLLVLAASGNSVNSGVYIPGRAKNVLTVGSHWNSPEAEKQNKRAPTSSYGPTYDARRKPDLVGPGGGGGTKVKSAKAAQDRMCATVELDGTSMATAAVAGAAALTREFLRVQWNMSDPSSALMRAALLHSTTTLADVGPRQSGFGRLDISQLLPHQHHTVARDLPPRRHWFLDDAVVLDGEVRQYCFALPNLSALIDGGNTEAGGSSSSSSSCDRNASLTVKATLVWNDPAAAVEGSRQSQVHDLDVMVVTRHGHTFFSGDVTGKRDRVNTVEQVQVPLTLSSDPVAATSIAQWSSGFRVLVRGAVVRNAAGQAFALAVSGPGLVAVEKCADLYAQWRSEPAGTLSSAPTTPVKAAGAYCPMNCSQRGTCRDEDSLLCVCASNYTSVDCAECNADVVCHGHGTCSDASTTTILACTCDPRGHFADAYCSQCEKGWYGPNCDSNCTCLNGGQCNTTTGLCTCPQVPLLDSQRRGCFQGAKCQYCCEGFGGPACNRRSHWCDTTGATVVVDDPAGGFIQIDGFDTYPYSVTCRWAIRAAPGQQIKLEILSYDIEDYDTLIIYDIVPDTSASVEDGSAATAPTKRRRVRRLTGTMDRAEPVITSTAASMDLEFVSDWDGVQQGFVLYYRFTSCSGRCQAANLTGTEGHWQCGDAFGLSTEQCICKPPFVGWHCTENAAALTHLDSALSRLHVSPSGVWKSGELGWLMPRSELTAVEVRLPVRKHDGTAAVDTTPPVLPDWHAWRNSTSAAATLTVPLAGMARLPLVVHGFSEVQVQRLGLPTPAFLPAHADAAIAQQIPSLVVIVHVTLSVQLQTEAAWLDRYAETLELSLGVSAAMEPTHDANSGSGTNRLTGAKTVIAFSHTSSPLSLDRFTFTPMTLQRLSHCTETGVIKVTAPLHLLDVTASENGTQPTGAGATTDNEEQTSYWTARLLFTLLWKDAAGLALPNVSVLDSLVVVHEATLTRAVAVEEADTEPAAEASVKGEPVPATCQTSTRLPPVRTGMRVIEDAAAPEQRRNTLSVTVVAVVLLLAVGVGAIGGTVLALRPLERQRRMYTVVQNTDEGQELDTIDRRGA